jgi:ribosomal protein S21
LKDAMKRVAHYEKPSDRERRKKGAQSRRASAKRST